MKISVRKQFLQNPLLVMHRSPPRYVWSSNSISAINKEIGPMLPFSKDNMKRSLAFVILLMLLIIIIIESASCQRNRFKNMDNKDRTVLPPTVISSWKITKPTPVYSILGVPDICPIGFRMDHRLSRCIRVSQFWLKQVTPKCCARPTKHPFNKNVFICGLRVNFCCFWFTPDSSTYSMRMGI